MYPFLEYKCSYKDVYKRQEILKTGVDGQAAVHLLYEGMNATVLYSKIADSYLPSEIQGEDGTLILEQIQQISEVDVYKRQS